MSRKKNRTKWAMTSPWNIPIIGYPLPIAERKKHEKVSHLHLFPSVKHLAIQPNTNIVTLIVTQKKTQNVAIYIYIDIISNHSSKKYYQYHRIIIYNLYKPCVFFGESRWCLRLSAPWPQPRLGTAHPPGDPAVGMRDDKLDLEGWFMSIR